jgi:GntR family transcriptional regulator
VEIRKLFVDDASPVPVYAQLCEQVLAAISRGDLRRGQQLPSVRDVAAVLGLNPNTVNRAWAELENDGVVEVRRGRGTFVSAARKSTSAPRLAEIAGSFVARARALGYEPPQILTAVERHLGRVRP